MKEGGEINNGLVLTAQELAQQKEVLEDIRQLAVDGFFTERVESKAVNQGHRVDSSGIVYQGGGNG